MKQERSDEMIQCKNVIKKYGKKEALADFSLELEKGKIIGILGPNGSGKTTFIKVLAGLLTTEGGVVRIVGKEIGVETKKMVSYLPERPYFSSSLKVKDTIRAFEDFYEDFDRDTAIKMLQTLQIDQNSKISSLSKGNREKVQLVLVMSRRAKIYLLDEPMGGVDPAARDFILKTILGNYNEEACVLISTHLISDVEKILDEVVFIKNGKMVLHESVDQIREEEQKSVDALFREVFAC